MEDPFKTVGYLLKKKNLRVFSSSNPEDFQHLSSDWVDFFYFFFLLIPGVIQYRLWLQQ